MQFFNSFQFRMDIKKISSNFNLLLFLIVFVEAFIVLILLNQASADILGGDGRTFYHPTTLNLLQHGSFALLNESNVLEPTMGKPPGYSFFLAFIYFFTGNSIIAVRIVQFLLFWLIGLGIYRVAKHFVDEKTSRISSVLSVTYLPLVFLSIYHASEVLATFLVVWIICKTIDWRESNKISDVIWAASLFGFLTLVRPNWALFAIPIFGLIYLSKKLKAVPNLLIFTLVSALFISPWLIRNYSHTGQIILSSVAKQVFYLSILQYEGKISYAFTVEEHHAFISDLNQRFAAINEKAKLTPANETLIDKELALEESYQADLVTERQNLTYKQILFSLPVRLAYLWSTCDFAPPEIYNTFYHRIAQIHFLFITALVLLGFYLRRSFIKTDWFLIAPAIYITVIHSIFLLEPRYSMPARPLLLIFAAVAIGWILNKFKGGVKKRTELSA